MKGEKAQGCKGARVQGCKGARVKRYKGEKVKRYKGEWSMSKTRINMIFNLILSCIVSFFGVAFIIGSIIQWNEPDRNSGAFLVIGLLVLLLALLVFRDYRNDKKELQNNIRDKYFDSYNKKQEQNEDNK